MDILLIAQRYHPFVGGVETHARQVAHELAKDHRVRVAAVNFSPSRLPRALRVLEGDLFAPCYRGYDDGPVPVHALTPAWTDRIRLLPSAVRALPRVRRYAYEGLNRFGYRWYRPVYLPRLMELMRGVDLVHSLAGGYLGWTARAASRKLGVPFVCTPFVHPGQWGDDRDSVRFYQDADAVIALVETDRRYLASLGAPQSRLHVIGVSPDVAPACDPAGFRARHGLGDAPVVLYVGRMMPQKGARSVLEAAPRVWKTRPETCFLFIGPLQAESASWFDGRDPRIRCLGKVSAQEKNDALAACDLFCMPSLSEILPTVYLEAWSYGKPVVGGMAPGLPELLEDNGAGLAVDQEPDEVAEALLRLLDHPEERARMGAQGRELVQKQYSVPAVTRALESLYASLCRPASRVTPDPPRVLTSHTS